jgi:endoglycosylceramidase
VDPSSGHFVDGHGRVRIFHGVNVVYKKEPWFPPSDKFDATDSLDNKTIDLLRAWGFNVVRLGVMWPGVEPEPGRIDGAYLQEISRLASALADRGVYTIADLHQDLGSRRFCGEGFPEHYVDALLADPGSNLSKAPAFPWPLPFEMTVNSTTGFPVLTDCLRHEFAEWYLTEQVGAMWEDLYTPGSALHDGFVRYWSVVSETFAQGAPHLLAYELLNEPSGFCLGGDLESCARHNPLMDNWMEGRMLTPLYRAAAAAIRSKDPERPILYQPSPVPKMTSAPPFPEPPLGNDPQQGLAYHIYCAPGDGDGYISGLVCRKAQDLQTSMYFDYLKERKGTAGFMTELGAIGGSPAELEHLTRLLDLADGAFQSWAYWQLKKYQDFTTANSAESLYDPEGNLEVEKLRTLSRTYAQAIAGRPELMSFDAQTAAFELRFNATVTSAPTEIYLNRQLHYPHGHSLRVQPEGCLRLESGEDDGPLLLVLDSARPSCMHNMMRVRITANATDKGPVSLLV